VSFHKAKKQLTSVDEIQSLTLLKVICTSAGKCWMPTHQPLGLILTCQNHSKMVRRMVLKCVKMQGQNVWRCKVIMC